MSFKRVWWRAVHSRGHLKPAAALTCTILLSTLLIDSVYVARRKVGPDDQGKNVYDQPTTSSSLSSSQSSYLLNLTHHSPSPPPPPPPSLSLPSSYELPDKQEALEGKSKGTDDAPEAQDDAKKPISKNSFFEEYKGRVVHKVSPQVHGINRNGRKKDQRTDDTKKHEGKKSGAMEEKREPSFGFVNKNFSPPPPRSSQRNGFLDLVQGFAKGETGLNPGKILGAVAALNQLKSSGQSDGGPLTTIMKVAEVVSQIVAPGRRLGEKRDDSAAEYNVHEQPHEHTHIFRGGNELKVSNPVGNEVNPRIAMGTKNVSQVNTNNVHSVYQTAPRQRPSGEEDRKGEMRLSNQGRQGSAAGGILGSLMSQLGPSLLAGVLGNNNNKQHSVNANPLQTFIGGLGSSLLAGMGNQGIPSSKEKPYSQRAMDSMSLGALISEVGPGLLVESLQKGFGGGGGNGNSNSGKPSGAFQSVLGGVGSALMQGLTQSQREGSDGSVQSLVGGLAPLLLAGVMGGQGSGAQGKHQSPIQQLVSNVGPALLKGALSNGFNGAGRGSGGIGGGGGVGIAGGERRGEGKDEGIGERRGSPKGKEGTQVIRNEVTKNKIKVNVINEGNGDSVSRNTKIISGVKISQRDSENNTPEEETKRLQSREEGIAIRRQQPGLPAESTRTRGSRTLQGREGDLDSDEVQHSEADGSPKLPSLYHNKITKDEREDTDRQTYGSASIKTRGLEEKGMKGKGEEEEEEEEEGTAGTGLKGVAVRLATKALLNHLVPEELPVPEVNSTRGLWDMAVNLVLGNPREPGGKKGQFWKWLREMAGGEETDEELHMTENKVNRKNTAQEKWDAPRKVIGHQEETNQVNEEGEDEVDEDTDNVLGNDNEARVSGGVDNDDFHDTITFHKRQQQQPRDPDSVAARVYSLLESPQPHLCRSSRVLGGVYTWKKSQLVETGRVCVDADVLPQSEDCLVYSLGLSPLWSFEEAMERLGCQVYAFDARPTTGNHDHSEGVHFYNLGVAEVNATRTVQGQIWNVFTLSAIMDKLGHSTSPLHYLRMDVPEEEWKVLQETLTNAPHHLTNIHQLKIKVHLRDALHDPALYETYLEVLQGLQGLGFQLMFSKGSQERVWNHYIDALGRRAPLRYDLVFLRI